MGTFRVSSEDLDTKHNFTLLDSAVLKFFIFERKSFSLVVGCLPTAAPWGPERGRWETKKN